MTAVIAAWWVVSLMIFATVSGPFMFDRPSKYTPGKWVVGLFAQTIPTLIVCWQVIR